MHVAASHMYSDWTKSITEAAGKAVAGEVVKSAKAAWYKPPEKAAGKGDEEEDL